MGFWKAAALATVAAGMPIMPVGAASLAVSPVQLQVNGPDATTTLTVTNSDTVPVVVQMRLFQWTHVNGKDQLTPTHDVVASPPMARLVPGRPYVVRIVRVKPAPVADEEAYRLFVDEIPAEQQVSVSGPRFALRESLPLFFTQPAAAPRLTWQASVSRGKLIVEAHNDGGKRVRISALNVLNSAGANFALAKGFAGYVFGRSTERWSVAAPKGLLGGGTITIVAQGENGPIRTQAKVQAAN